MLENLSFDNSQLHAKDDTAKLYIATVYLVLFCTHLLPIEGLGANWLKVGAMALAPIIMLRYARFVSSAMFWSALYFGVIFIVAITNPNFRGNTLIFSLLFLLMYVMFYNLVHANAFSRKQFLHVVEWLIFAYTIVLVLQQACNAVALYYMPLFNLVANTAPKYNALALEASHAARIVGVCGYAWLKVQEIEQGKPITILYVFKNHRKLLFAWLYTIVFLGAGTAFVVLSVICLYFLRTRIAVIYGIILFGILNMLPYIDYEPLQRATATFEAVQTLDRDKVFEADSSAATRLFPFLNTIHELDPSKEETWFGHGVDAAKNAGVYSRETLLGCITDYGLIAYVISLFLVYSCAIPFFSIANLMFWCGIGGGVNNIAYGWGILMIFTCVKYFISQKPVRKQEVLDDKVEK